MDETPNGPRRWLVLGSIFLLALGFLSFCSLIYYQLAIKPPSQ